MAKELGSGLWRPRSARHWLEISTHSRPVRRRARGKANLRIRASTAFLIWLKDMASPPDAAWMAKFLCFHSNPLISAHFGGAGDVEGGEGLLTTESLGVFGFPDKVRPIRASGWVPARRGLPGFDVRSGHWQSFGLGERIGLFFNSRYVCSLL